MIKYNATYDRWVTDTGIVYRQDNTGAFIECKQDELEGYKRVSVCKSICGKKKVRVHRLVWETFKGEIPPGYEIDHIDTCRDNNYLTNLKICTRKENANNPLTRKHISEAQKGKHKVKCKINPFSYFGNKFKEHYGLTKRDNIKLYKKEHSYYKRYKRLSWEVNNEVG